MRKLLTALLVALAYWPALALAQVGIINGATPWVGFTPGQCFVANANGTVTGTTCGGSSGITVGSTTITSGTSGRVAYNNAGVYGEYAISGTGNVAMTTSPTFVTPTLGAATATSLTTALLTGTAGTVATSTPVVNLTQTWNDGGAGTTVFTGILANFTRTSGAATSLMIDLQVGGSSKFNVNQAGSLVAGNTITSTGNMISGGTMTVATSSGYFFSARSQIASSGDGNIRLANNAGTGFTSLTFGVQNTSFPSLRMNGANLQVALGDNSNNTGLQAGSLHAANGTTLATGVPFGGIGMAKATDPASAPGAGFVKMMWVAGTNAGTCKLIAYAGTSTTPGVILDNVGAGC